MFHRLCLTAISLTSLPVLAATAPSGFEKPDQVFTIKTLPSLMKYDQTALRVAPGQKIRIDFVNEDQLPHNLALLKGQGMFLDFAQKAWNLGENGPQKQWLPQDDRLVTATQLIDPGKSESVYFQAPNEETEMEYVCTFPGHAMIMNGKITVTNAAPPGLRNLTYMLFKGDWNKLPDFLSLPQEAKVRTDEINDGKITLGVAKDMKSHYGVVYQGTLTIPEEAEYRLFAGSDDGLRVIIDDKPLLEIDNIHPYTEKRARWKATKGDHAVKVEYFQGGGEAELNLVIDGPGFRRVALTDTMRKRGQETPEIVLNADGDRPKLYRGFLSKSGGSRRMIAAGCPGGINFAFDQDQLRLGLLWKGAFLDAGRHWSGRGDGDIAPEGYAVVELPQHEGFATLTAPDSPWPATAAQHRATHGRFIGYTLNQKGYPTFRYSAADHQVEVTDRVMPEGDMTKGTDHVVRTLSLKSSNASASQGLYFKVLDGAPLKQEGSRFKQGQTMSVEIEGAQPTVIGSSLLVPITFVNGQATLTLRYFWF